MKFTNSKCLDENVVLNSLAIAKTKALSYQSTKQSISLATIEIYIVINFVRHTNNF